MLSFPRNYCPLIWMCHSRSLNARINKIRERALRIVYNDSNSSFEELLVKSIRIHLWAYGVVVSMFDFHRSDRGTNPGSGGKIS